MRVDFKKIGRVPKSVELTQDGVTLKGELQLGKDALTDFKGKLSDNIQVQCAKCGETFTLALDEELVLKFSDGIYRGFDEEADIIEFYDGSIDLGEVLRSEIESIKLDYHICPKCKGEENGSTKETCK